MRLKSFILATAMAVCSTVGLAQQVLDNDTVVKMHASGLGDVIIISTINGQAGSYLTSASDLIVLKHAGMSDLVIDAMIAKKSSAVHPATDSAATVIIAGQPPNGPSAASLSDSATSQSAAAIFRSPALAPKPRVFFQSESHGNTANARRDQSMEMSKDFEKSCPAVRISINQQAADYTVVLNHIEIGLFVRDNQIQVADKNGDLISKTKEGGSIAGGVKKACDTILADWNQKTNP